LLGLFSCLNSGIEVTPVLHWFGWTFSGHCCNEIPFDRTKMPIQRLNACLRLAVATSVILSLQACAVVAVADAAVTVVATGVKVTAKAVGAVVGAVIPD
jgi:hypothetical protein